MRKLNILSLAVVCLLLSALSSYAQITEAVITFDYIMKADDPGIQQQLSALEGSSMTMSFKDHYFRTDTDMAMNITSIIYDGKKKNKLTLMNMMGLKWAIPSTKEEWKLEEEERLQVAKNKVISTNEYKTIAGYKCQKVIVDGNVLYLTKEIKPENNQNEYQFGNIEGFPLMMESKLEENGTIVTITIMAKSIQKQINDEAIFSTAIPGGYTEKTMADLE